MRTPRRHVPQSGSPTTAPAEPPKTAAAILQTQAQADAQADADAKATRNRAFSDAWLRELEAKAQAQWRAIVGLGQ